MALPIWGIFMKKVLEDGTLGITPYDQFVAPQGFNLNLNCDGSDSDIAAQEKSAEENYFGF